jgi:hypothetical protein
MSDFQQGLGIGYLAWGLTKTFDGFAFQSISFMFLSTIILIMSLSLIWSSK